MKLWRNSKNQLVLTGENELWIADSCPCDCEPKIIAEWTTNGSTPQPPGTVKCVDFTPYQGNCMGPPGGRWRSLEVGACLIRGGQGDIDENGKLVGLPDSYCSGYSYNGYIKLEVGCRQPDGKIKWATRCS